MRYRANARVVGATGQEIGRVTYHVKAKNKAGAMSKIKKLFNARPRKRKKNVEQGFYDSKGRFHPIRTSSDYSERRAGTGAARSRTRRARRGRQAIS
jgi:hypothetical protein